MATNVTFYTDPTNMDYLMGDVRLQFGDLTGDTFSDTIIRTAMISAIRFLQRKWDGKYQVYSADQLLDPQPSGVPAGYKRIRSLHGEMDIPTDINVGSIYRDAYSIFTAGNPPLIESVDEQAIILAAVYILRKAHLTSNASDFVAWGTEDIRYNNLGAERGLSKLLQADLDALNEYLRARIAKPIRSEFPQAYIPMI